MDNAQMSEDQWTCNKDGAPMELLVGVDEGRLGGDHTVKMVIGRCPRCGDMYVFEVRVKEA